MHCLINFYFICVSRKVVDQVNTSLIYIIKRLKAHQWIPSIEPVHRHITSWMKENMHPYRKDSTIMPKFIFVIFLPAFPKRTYKLLQLCIGEKKMTKLFRHNVHLFGLTLIPDISKCHSSFSSHSRSLWRSAD